MRDSKGRFTKVEGLKISFHIPSFSNIVFWILLLALIFPWISIICRLDILKKLLSFFDDLMRIPKEEEKEIPKKNGLFS